MKLEKLNLTELDLNQLLSINGGAHVPANDWNNFKKGVKGLVHEIGDFVRGIYDGLG